MKRETSCEKHSLEREALLEPQMPSFIILHTSGLYLNSLGVNNSFCTFNQSCHIQKSFVGPIKCYFITSGSLLNANLLQFTILGGIRAVKGQCSDVNEHI